MTANHAFATMTAVALATALVGTASAADRCAGKKPYLIYYATHAIAEPVWATVKKGAEQGADDNCLRIKWTQDQKFSIETTINRMETAISEKPDLLVITATDPTAMRPTVDKAVAAGIPIIAINVLDPAPKGQRLPYLIGIGADLYQSGVAAAQQILKKNPHPKHALVPNHVPGHVGLEQMAKGFTDTLQKAGATTDVIAIGTDTSQTAATISNYFLAHPDTDALFCMNAGPFCFETVLDVARREKLGAGDRLSLVTFDVSPALLDAIGSGEAVAGIDQLMYLQGYLPVVLARTYLDYGMMPDADIVTGPAIIDKSNLDKVRHRLMEAGLN
ncbi:substrate-binding domain-containing protein [Mesorhizobium sp. B4-1-4]|uniref:substrate-binding domain-containing protein n=1 Tax=Mesorhizobium sp. B4-1-4 TaxID=2589888 RepID=UPI0011283B28|nr:substrate-binding domain-containing protein [Mesorhizobium sp. B4-1-4]UCI32084.1 substrate-binding domain-containing protein [Mesorhizobium sp. B4-1-4]